MTRASDLAKLLGAGATILDGTTISTADNDPQLILTSTDADGDRGPVVQFTRDSGSPADNDVLGRVQFLFDNDAAEVTTAVQLEATATDVSNGTEDSALNLVTMVDGNTRGRLKFTSSEAVFNDDSIDSDFRVEGNGDANALFVEGETDNVGVGTNDPASKMTVSTGVNSSTRTFLVDNAHSGGSMYNALGVYVGATDRLVTLSADYGDSIMAFQTAGSERMRIHSTGSVSIGTTDTQPQSGGSAFKVESLSRRSLIMSQSGTGNANIIVFFSGGNLSGAINIASGSVSYGSGSDYRIKENIVDLTDATTRLKQLQPKRFNFITNPDDEARDGFLAHEVSSIVPEAVIGEKDAVDENGEIIVQQLDPSKLVPLLTKTILELEARITALESA